MENILNLETYSKYKSLFDDGLILVPDNNLSNLIDESYSTRNIKPWLYFFDIIMVTLRKLEDIDMDNLWSMFTTVRERY